MDGGEASDRWCMYALRMGCLDAGVPWPLDGDDACRARDETNVAAVVTIGMPLLRLSCDLDAAGRAGTMPVWRGLGHSEHFIYIVVTSRALPQEDAW